MDNIGIFVHGNCPFFRFFEVPGILSIVCHLSILEVPLCCPWFCYLMPASLYIFYRCLLFCSVGLFP